VLRSRVPTTGIIEYKFQDGDTVFRYAGPDLGTQCAWLGDCSLSLWSCNHLMSDGLDGLEHAPFRLVIATRHTTV
jgi:hypothetical protein